MVTAVTLAAELGDFARFGNARQLMAYVGLRRAAFLQTGQVSIGEHHPQRQRSRAASVDRGGLGLPVRPASDQGAANAADRLVGEGLWDRLEGAGRSAATSVC